MDEIMERNILVAISVEVAHRNERSLARLDELVADRFVEGTLAVADVDAEVVDKVVAQGEVGHPVFVEVGGGDVGGGAAETLAHPMAGATELSAAWLV